MVTNSLVVDGDTLFALSDVVAECVTVLLDSEPCKMLDNAILRVAAGGAEILIGLAKVVEVG